MSKKLQIRLITIPKWLITIFKNKQKLIRKLNKLMIMVRVNMQMVMLGIILKKVLRRNLVIENIIIKSK